MSAVSDALNTLWTHLEQDELAIVLPLADSYFTNIVANPAPANVVAQSLALETAVIAALPNMEAAAAKDVSTALKSLMDAQIALPVAPVSAPPVADAAPAA